MLLGVAGLYQGCPIGSLWGRSSFGEAPAAVVGQVHWGVRGQVNGGSKVEGECQNWFPPGRLKEAKKMMLISSSIPGESFYRFCPIGMQHNKISQ